MPLIRAGADRSIARSGAAPPDAELRPTRPVVWLTTRDLW